MILVLVIGGGIGWKANRARTQKQAVEAIRALNGTVLHDFERSFGRPFDKRPSTPPQPPGPIWLRKWIGDEYFQEVTNVYFKDPLTGPLPLALEKFDHLETVSIVYESKGDDNLTLLGRLTTLREVTLRGRGVTDRSLEHLAKLPLLEHMWLERVAVTDAGLAHLANLPRLTHLSMGTIPGITEIGLKNLLGNRPKLEILALDGMDVNDAGMELIGNIVGLKKLNIQKSRITDVGLAHISKLTSLDFLMINGMNTSISDAGLASLRGLENLKELFVTGKKVTDAGVASLGELKKLERLDLSFCDLTDAGIVNLAGLSNLKELNFLICTQIGDASLVHLAKLPRLQKLALVQSNVTDAGLLHLYGLKSLRQLNLRDTRVTSAGLDALRSAMPKVIVASGATASRRPPPKQ